MVNVLYGESLVGSTSTEKIIFHFYNLDIGQHLGLWN